METFLSYLATLLIAVNSWWGGGEVASTTPAVPVSPVEAEVVQVLDGDTIDVVIEGERERVRYIGIDSPEINYDTGVPECFAAEARAYNRALVGGQTVLLTTDTSKRDDYNRLLRYVELNGESVGEELVAAGYARAIYIEPDTVRYGRFKEAEDEARASGAGLWSACYFLLDQFLGTNSLGW